MNWYCSHYVLMWKRFFALLSLQWGTHLFIYEKRRRFRLLIIFIHWMIDICFALLDIMGVPYLYQIIDHILKESRPLTEQELNILMPIFGNLFPYKMIRIDHKAILGPRQRNFVYVSFNTINSWGVISNKMLIHEAVHIWQYYRFGSSYIHHSWYAQLQHPSYDYGGGAQLLLDHRNHKNLIGYNFEQMACIISDSCNINDARFTNCYNYFVAQLQVDLGMS